MLKKHIVRNYLQISEVVVRRCSVKKVFLEISQNSQENTCTKDSFLIKLQAEKETLAQVFSCEFCKITKNTFSYGTPPVAASEISLLILSEFKGIKSHEVKIKKTSNFTGHHFCN